MTESTSAVPPIAERGDSVTQEPISTKPLVSKRTRRATLLVSVLVVLVVLAGLGAMGYFMYTSYDASYEGLDAGAVAPTARLRDMAIVVLALETLAVMVLLLIIVVLLVALIILAYDRVIPILEQMNRAINNAADTVHTVRGTTEFVSERVVTPVITVSSYAKGVVGILRGIRDLWPGRGSNGS